MRWVFPLWIIQQDRKAYGPARHSTGQTLSTNHVGSKSRCQAAFQQKRCFVARCQDYDQPWPLQWGWGGGGLNRTLAASHLLYQEPCKCTNCPVTPHLFCMRVWKEGSEITLGSAKGLLEGDWFRSHLILLNLLLFVIYTSAHTGAYEFFGFHVSHDTLLWDAHIYRWDENLTQGSDSEMMTLLAVGHHTSDFQHTDTESSPFWNQGHYKSTLQ